MKKIFGILAATSLLTACSGTKGQAAETANADHDATAVTKWETSADSLYKLVVEQVSFGPRTPGSTALKNCGDLIVERLHQYGVDSVAQQLVPVTTFKRQQFTARNILGCINPEATRRVLLLAHYDTRPWADNDPSPEAVSQPVLGANDGASGVAVLLETARVLTGKIPDALGIDLLFVDMEDSGESGGDNEDSWCLGTQQWVQHMPYTSNNRPIYALLLDMVGGNDAKFHREYFSHRDARSVVDHVWSCAAKLNLSDRFVNSVGGAIVDDHLYINAAGIPCADIIENKNPTTGSFNPTWHTTNDDLNGIDRQTLNDVATVVVNAITQ